MQPNSRNKTSKEIPEVSPLSMLVILALEVSTFFARSVIFIFFTSKTSMIRSVTWARNCQSKATEDSQSLFAVTGYVSFFTSAVLISNPFR